LIDHPEKQLAIETIGAARAERKGLKAIARLLEVRGLPCRANGGTIQAFARSSVRKRWPAYSWLITACSPVIDK
jgi:hypothetical protein